MIILDGELRAGYNCYYVFSEMALPDMAAALEHGNNFLSPAETGVCVSCGTDTGPLRMRIDLVDQLPPLPDDVVASQCSFNLPSGVVIISDPMRSDLNWRYDLGRPTLLGMQVRAWNRDKAHGSAVVIDTAIERHEIYLAPVKAPVALRRSSTRDVMLQNADNRRRR